MVSNNFEAIGANYAPMFSLVVRPKIDFVHTTSPSSWFLFSNCIEFRFANVRCPSRRQFLQRPFNEIGDIAIPRRVYRAPRLDAVIA